MTEIYKDIQGYEGLYQISNYGNVKSLNYRRTGKEAVLRCCVDKGGYLFVCLWKNGKRKHFLVHRLVAETFIPNPENKPCVDHVNTIRDYNCSSNLRWCSYEENMGNEISRKNISLAMKGNQNGKGKRSDETKRKMSLSKKGNKSTKGKHWKLENGKRVYY